jgi:elongation factor G
VARIAFVNKLDRDGANFDKVVQSIADKLHTTPLVLTLPVYEGTSVHTGAPIFVGLVDLLTMQLWRWGGSDPAASSVSSAGQGGVDTGVSFEVTSLPSSHDMYAQALQAREHLVEQVAGADDAVLEVYLAEQDSKRGGAMHVESAMLRAALRRIVTALPKPTSAVAASAEGGSSSSGKQQYPQPYTLVVCGSAKANKGIQFLLNSVVDYLPSPLDKQFIELEPFAVPTSTSTGRGGKSSAASAAATASASAPPPAKLVKSVSGDPSRDPLVALAFKVSHDLSRGAMPIVFVRVYTGAVRKGDLLVSVSPPDSFVQQQQQQQQIMQPGGKTPSSSAANGSAAGSSSSSPGASLSSLPRERPQKLLEIFADNLSLELPAIESGNIGALVGLKAARTGDTILSASSASTASATSASAPPPKPGQPDPRVGYLRGITFSEPVFFCSVEAGSQSAQTALDQALACLQREDPSLLVSVDPESGQTLLKGMGELHLDIIRSRLRHDFQLGGSDDPNAPDADDDGGVQFGKMKISYRETLATELRGESFRFTAGNLVSGAALSPAEAEVTLTLLIEPLEVGQGVEVEVDGTGTPMAPATAHAPAAQAMRQALEAGVRDGLARGPLLGYPMTDVRVSVSELILSPTASTQALCNSLRGGAARLLTSLIRTAAAEDGRSVLLLEPVMRAEVSLNAGVGIGDVLSDLSAKRRANILEVGQHHSSSSSSSALTGSGGASKNQQQQQRSYIHAEVPLACMLGYASALRSTTQGQGSFSMHFVQFRPMPLNLQRALIESPP